MHAYNRLDGADKSAYFVFLTLCPAQRFVSFWWPGFLSLKDFDHTHSQHYNKNQLKFIFHQMLIMLWNVVL